MRELAASLGAVSPQSTRRSVPGIAALPKLSPDLLERHRGKPTNVGGRQSILLIDVLAVPPAGEGFDDARRFTAMLLKRIVELRTCLVVLEPFSCPDVIWSSRLR